MSETLQLTLFLTSFLLITSLTPGPNNTILMTYALNYGLKPTIPLILAKSIGYTSLFVSLLLFIQYLLLDIYLVLNVVKIGGSVFMLFMAYKLVTNPASSHTTLPASHHKHKKIHFLHMFFFQFANPKAITTATYAITIFASHSLSLKMNLLSSVLVCLVSIVSAVVWSAGGHYLNHILNTPRKKFLFSFIMASLLVLTSLVGLYYSFIT